MQANYQTCLTKVLASEGGYTNDANDPGGPTNYGITIADYRKYINPNATATDVKNMKLSDAQSIYKSKYWDAMSCDQLPSGVDYTVFDYGVNSGISRSAKILQQYCNVAADGVIGPNTLAAVSKQNAVTLINEINTERLQFLQGLSTWSDFGVGWGRRVASVKAASLLMAQEPIVTTTTTSTTTQPSSPGVLSEIGQFLENRYLK